MISRRTKEGFSMIPLRQDTRHMERVSRDNILRVAIHFFTFRCFIQFEKTIIYV
jgi:hypothetical protein